MAKVLMVTGDAAESLEVYYPYQRLLEEGHTVKVAAPSQKVLQLVVHDFVPGYDTYTEKPGYTLKADIAFADVRPQEFDALIIPGGRAPEYIRNDPGLHRIVEHFVSAEKPIAAICHAALVLAPLGALKGKRTTAYPALKPDVEAAGGTYVDEEVVVDGRLIASRAWPDHPGFMRQFLAQLT